MGDSFYHMLQHNFFIYITSAAFQMQNFLTSFQQHCVIICCDVIAVVYEKFIPWVISTGYKGKHVIKVHVNILHVKNEFSFFNGIM